MSFSKFISIQCDGLEVNGSELLRPFHFEIGKATALALIGKNGAGKTTLLRHLSGMAESFKFTMQIQEKEWRRISLRERAYKVGWLPQRLQYISDFTVLDLALLGRFAWHQGFPTKDDVKKCDRRLDQLEILSFRERKLSQLSGGELQRAALARVFSSDVEMMVLDEPFSGLDVDSSLTVLRLIRELCEEGRTVVYSLHGFDLLSLHEGPLLAIAQDRNIKKFENVRDLNSNVMKSIFSIDVDVQVGKHTYFHLQL